MVRGCPARDEGDGRTTRDARERLTRPRGRLAKRTPCPVGDSGEEMTDEDREWARRTAAGLPPLTDRQRDVLALLLGRRRWHPGA